MTTNPDQITPAQSPPGQTMPAQTVPAQTVPARTGNPARTADPARPAVAARRTAGGTSAGAAGAPQPVRSSTARSAIARSAAVRPATARPAAVRSGPVRPATVRRALDRIATGVVRTYPNGREGAPALSARTLRTLEARNLVSYGRTVPGLGRPIRTTRAGSHAMIGRGPAGVEAWVWLLAQDEVWMAADGRTRPIRDMPAPYRANAAAWLQRNAAAIRRQAAPRRRLDPVAWIDATPLMRALIGSSSG